MKTNLTLTLSTLAVFAAILVVNANTGAAGIAYTALGVLAIFHADYARNVEPLRARARLISIEQLRENTPDLSEAA